NGDAIDFSLFTDGLKAEREQGITIDVAYRYFETRRRKFILADTPGHAQYTRNMATGASAADAAIILVDARLGVLPQTRRHATIAGLLGIRRLAVAVNKMDLAGFDPGTFQRIADQVRTLAASLGFTQLVLLPVSARLGDNVVQHSPRTPWYRGGTVLDVLESIEVQRGRAGRGQASGSDGRMAGGTAARSRARVRDQARRLHLSGTDRSGALAIRPGDRRTRSCFLAQPQRDRHAGGAHGPARRRGHLRRQPRDRGLHPHRRAHERDRRRRDDRLEAGNGHRARRREPDRAGKGPLGPGEDRGGIRSCEGCAAGCRNRARRDRPRGRSRIPASCDRAGGSMKLGSLAAAGLALSTAALADATLLNVSYDPTRELYQE